MEDRNMEAWRVLIGPIVGLFFALALTSSGLAAELHRSGYL